MTLGPLVSSTTADALSHSHHRINVEKNAMGVSEVVGWMAKDSVVLAFAGQNPTVSAYGAT